MTISRTTLRNLLLGLAGVTLLILLAPILLYPLIETSGYMPHGHCYLWQPGLVWLHAGSDLLIGLSYVAISIALISLLSKIRDLVPYGWMILAFGIFIIACGGTHFMEVWTLWEPVYWLSGGIKGLTAAASLYTAIALPPLVPRIIAMTREARVSDERRQELEVRNQELQTLYEKVRELDVVKTRFFANVSHDLRTPLTLIIGPVEQMLREDKIDSEERRRLEKVLQNALSLRTQVNDLLDLSKMEAGKMELDLKPVDIAAMVRLVGANLETFAHTSKIHLQIEAKESLILLIDQEKIQRALLNLLSNGLSFTPPDGTLRITLKSVSDGIAVEVADSGPGIPLEDRERLFERYEQGNPGTREGRFGTGLGLAIAKEMVELHDGSLTVGDAVEGGALFTLFLPSSRIITDSKPTELSLTDHFQQFVAPPPTRKGEGTHPTLPTNDNPEKKPVVLVVEDNVDMQEYLVETLSSQYHVVTASNGEVALEVMQTALPSLVLTDIMMPVMGGVELLTKMREREETREIPVIVLTARGEEELRIDLLKRGAQDYVEKPFAAEELLVRVRQLVVSNTARSYLREAVASQSQDLATLAQELRMRNSELQQTVLQLQSSRSLTDQLWQSGIIGMGVSTLDGKILDANDHFLEIIGYTQDDLKGVGIDYRKITPAVDLQLTDMAVGKIRNTGMVAPFEKSYLHKDGTPVPVMVGAAAIEGEEGKNLFFVLDLTLQKQAEAEVRKLNANLEERVQQRTAELLAINTELEAFSYAVSHDLRAPLRAINGFAHALTEDYSEGLDPAALHYLQRIERNVMQMEELIGSLLNLSRISRIELTRTEVNLSDLAHSIITQFQENEPDRNVDVSIEENLHVTGDPHLLRIMLENLLGNAWKFTAHTPNAAITLRKDIEGGETVLIVEDNGAGFDQANAGDLFQPFKRLHSEAEFKGTGIGLATVRRIINRHGGTIRGEGSVGMGARFTFKLS